MGRPKKYKNDYPSVTEIVDLLDKPGLRYWYGKYGTAYCEKVKKESQDIGHGVHAGIEKYVGGKPFSEASEGLSDQQKLMLSCLVEWVEKNNIKFKNTEQVLYSKEHKFGGTYDGLACADKLFWIVDWKTDSTPASATDERERSFKYALQMAGYSILLNESEKILANQAKVIRISKKLEFKEYVFEDLAEYKKLFLNLRAVYKYLRGR